MDPYLHAMDRLDAIMETNVQENQNRVYPQGAFSSVEQFVAYVKGHQILVDPTYRPSDHYMTVCDQFKRLRTLQLPQTWAMVYVGHVPMDPTHSYVETIYVPEFDALVHDQRHIDEDPEREHEIRHSVPGSFLHWRRRTGDENCPQFTEWYEHARQVGLLLNNHCSDWFLFANEADAVAYIETVKASGKKPTEQEIEAINELERLSDVVMFMDYLDMDPMDLD